MNSAAENLGQDQVQEFLTSVHLHYGYDFRAYAETSMRRRIGALMHHLVVPDVAQLQELLASNPALLPTALRFLTVSVSELFRDPDFFAALRREVIPVLATYPVIRIWLAGCGHGEEVYSLAIVLKEAGLFERTVMYATDINLQALEAAQLGIYPLDQIQKGTVNYQKAGGKDSFATYYTADYGRAKLAPELIRNAVFASHNLAVDGVFSEFHLVLCRNVLIYFKRDLQNHVLGLLSRSLIYRGFLCMGNKETIKFMDFGTEFEEYDRSQRIFRRNSLQQPGLGGKILG